MFDINCYVLGSEQEMPLELLTAKNVVVIYFRRVSHDQSLGFHKKSISVSVLYLFKEAPTLNMHQPGISTLADSKRSY